MWRAQVSVKTEGNPIRCWRLYLSHSHEEVPHAAIHECNSVCCVASLSIATPPHVTWGSNGIQIPLKIAIQTHTNMHNESQNSFVTDKDHQGQIVSLQFISLLCNCSTMSPFRLTPHSSRSLYPYHCLLPSTTSCTYTRPFSLCKPIWRRVESKGHTWSNQALGWTLHWRQLSAAESTISTEAKRLRSTATTVYWPHCTTMQAGASWCLVTSPTS